MFEKATRQKYRFDSLKGQLTVEQLWDLPLQAKNGFDLDTVAKVVNQELKGVTEDSFIETRSNPRKGELEDKLEVVKHIIATKQAENAAKLDEANRKVERERLQQILATKQAQQLEGLSVEEIQKRLDALS